MSEPGSPGFKTGAMRWSIDDSEDFVVVRTEGFFNVDDHSAMVKDVIRRPFWSPGRNAFFDHRLLEFDGAGYEVMRNAVDTHRAHDAEIGDGRAAVLMSCAADFGVGRIFDIVAHDRVQANMRIFTDETEALVWLRDSDRAT